jgi:hypothetical protein
MFEQPLTSTPTIGRVLSLSAFTTPIPKHNQPCKDIAARADSPFSVRSEMSPIDAKDLDFPLPPNGSPPTRASQAHNPVDMHRGQIGQALGGPDTVESPIDSRSSPFRLGQKKQGQRTSWRDSWRASWRDSWGSSSTSGGR